MSREKGSNVAADGFMFGAGATTGAPLRWKRRPRGTVPLLLALLVAASAVAADPGRPNIVLIVADDVAFSDLGAYGSEIRTPNIDALAERGTRFSNVHATPMCAPSRAMLMTGLDNHRAGLGNLPETTPPEHRDSPAYRGTLTAGLPTIADRLRRSGYRTFMTGKWHLGHTPESLPSARGFDRSFILDATGADNWEDRPYLPVYDEATWIADGEPADLPDDFYSSGFLVDRMIDFVGDKPSGDPFFAYVAFTAVHIPVQAPREFTMRYEGVYDDGWQAQRERRATALKAQGLIPKDAPLGPMHPDLREWSELPAAQRAWHSRAMMVYAGMLEAMDHHLGRLIEHLRRTGAYDNTVFLVTSDNGPEGASPIDMAAMRLWLKAVGYSTDINTLGERGSYGFVGPEWASASASPHALFKFYATEGGTRVPLIVAGPGVEAGRTADQLSVVSDIPATIAAIAGARAEGMTGRSLVPALHGNEDAVYGPEDGFGIETAGRCAYFQGHYKIVRNGPPLGDNVWRLHDLAKDPGEVDDLSASEPERFAAMRAAYERWALDNGVLEMPEGYQPLEMLLIHSRERLLARYWWIVAAAVALLIVLPGGWMLRRTKRRAAAAT